MTVQNTLGEYPTNGGQTHTFVGGSIYPYQQFQQETTRVVETTVTETFDENGKLYERITKTVTRYEKAPQYQIWNQSPHTQILPCTTASPIITN